ncbi:MAG: hypothetical protein RJA98_3554 [Pseudomonadota bacterium]
MRRLSPPPAPHQIPAAAAPTSRGATAIVLAVAALASACATVQPHSAATLPALTLPAQWSDSAAATATAASSNSAALATWWQHFNDPLLSALVSDALQANTSVASARAALQQARAQREVSAAGLSPQLNASGSAQRSRSATSANTSTSSLFKAGLDASWEPDVFGGNHAAVTASDADARTSAAQLAQTQVSIAAEVALAYLDVRGTQARLGIARDNLASQLETLQLTRWRAQAGLASTLDTEQAQTSADQTRATIPPLETTLAQSRHALAVLTGQTPAALDARLAAVLPLPQPAETLALTLPADTLRQRPDVQAAEAAVQAAAARIDQAQAARLPSFALSGSLGLSALSLGGSTTALAALLGSVSAPLWDGGAGAATVNVRQAQLTQAQEAWRASVLTALQDSEDALVALRQDRERVTYLKSASTAANSAALLARQRYASGLIDFQTVLQTQRTALSTQDSLASAQASVSADHVRLYKALGGGWTPTAQ